LHDIAASIIIAGVSHLEAIESFIKKIPQNSDNQINIDSKNPYDYIPPSTVFEQRNIGRLKTLPDGFFFKIDKQSTGCVNTSYPR
jgi:hypothetical protein